MRRIKLPTLADIASLAAFILALPFGLVLRRRHPDLWLVSERPDEARDNAYWFFKYVHENRLHPDTFYVIRKTSPDAARIRSIAPDRLILFGSPRHYIYYVASSMHISAHIGGGMPNARVCRVLENRGLLHNRKVFVQHGITKDTPDWLSRHHARVDLFCCSAEREMQHVLDAFGYSEAQVALTGLCRYDQLPLNAPTDRRNAILMLPTWRKYLVGLSEQEFKASTYFQTYSKLLSSPTLLELLRAHECQLVFHLHPGMQDYSHLFHTSDESISISEGGNDIQMLLKGSSLLITDYSSVFFDSAYMRRPLVYYQFDYADFREGHWATGYFDYEADGFGQIVHTEAELLEAISAVVDSGFAMEASYAARADEFFEHRDTSNCARTFQAIHSLPRHR